MIFFLLLGYFPLGGLVFLVFFLTMILFMVLLCVDLLLVVLTSVGQFSLILENNQFSFFKENWLNSYFFLK